MKKLWSLFICCLFCLNFSLQAQTIDKKEHRAAKNEQQKVEKQERRSQRKLYRWRKQELRRWRAEERRAAARPLQVFRRPARSDSEFDIDVAYRFREQDRSHELELDLSSISHRQPFFPNAVFYSQWPGMAIDAFTYLTFYYTVQF